MEYYIGAIVFAVLLSVAISYFLHKQPKALEKILPPIAVEQLHSKIEEVCNGLKEVHNKIDVHSRIEDLHRRLDRRDSERKEEKRNEIKL